MVTTARVRCFGVFLGLLVLLLVVGVLARPAEAQVAEADLSLQKFDFPPDQVAVGEPLSYELAVANLGPDTAVNAVVEDNLPSNTEFLFTISGNCTNVGQTVTCDLGDLAPNEQAFVEFTVCPRAAGTATNTATTSSDTLDPNGANNTDSETTEVTMPAVGACPSQEEPAPQPEPSPESPQPQPAPNDPSPVPNVQPAPSQSGETATNVNLCSSSPVAIGTQNFALACSGNQTLAIGSYGPEVANTGVCPPGPVAIGSQDSTLVCAGSQTISVEGYDAGGISINGEPVDVNSTVNSLGF